MAKFLMLGKYSLQSVKGIAASRTKKAVALIEKSGGRIISKYVLLGEYDLALVVELAGVKEAMKFSIALTKMSGIAFTSLPALSVEEFDRMMG